MFETIEEAPIIFMFQGLSGAQEYTSAHFETNRFFENEKTWKQYVNQSVKEIRNLTDKESWNHCPGAMNPADLPSRGIRVDEMVSNPLWWNGPAFLQRPEEEWPKLGIKKKSIRQQRMRSSNNQKLSRVCWLELLVLKFQTWPP
jgi:hypothetical protein